MSRVPLSALLSREDLPEDARRQIAEHLESLREESAQALPEVVRYRALMGAEGVLAAVLGPDLAIRVVSDASAALLGATPGDLAGRPFLEHYASTSFGARDAITEGIAREGEARLLGRCPGLHRQVHVVAWRLCAIAGSPGPATEYLALGDDVTRSRRTESILTALVAGTSRVLGSDFLQALVCELTRAVGCRSAWVATVDPQAPLRAVAIAVAGEGEPQPAFDYDLAATPCARVLAGTTCVHPAGVRASFPGDLTLASLSAESYVGAPLVDAQGKPCGLLAIVDDRPLANPEEVEFVARVFAQRAGLELSRARSHEALAGSERRFRRLFEGSADAQMLLEGEHVVDCNAAAAALFGAESREALCGLTPGSLSPASQSNGRPSASESRRRLAEAFADGSARFEWLHVRRDGTPFHAEVVLTALTVEHHRALLAVVRDITDRVRAEEQLAASRERLELALRGADLGLWDWNVRTGEISVNDRAWEMLGYDPGELPSDHRTWMELVHPDDGERMTLATHRHLEGTSTIYESEHRLRARDGHWVWVLDRGRLVQRDAAGRPVRMAGTHLDITHWRTAQEESERYQAQLRALGSRLATAQEDERRRIASGLHDSVAQLLVGAGLELAALRGSVPDEAVGQSLAAVTGLVNQAAGEVRSLMFEISPPLLYDLGLGAAVDWFAARVEAQHGLPVEVHDGSGGLPQDEAGKVTLFHAARELLLNVVEHSGATRAVVRLWPGDSTLRVSVEDDGAGFDASAVAPNMETMASFGLFSIRERLEGLGGRMRVESAPGRGTLVELELPLVRTDPGH